MSTVVSRILDGIASDLAGITGVDTLMVDPARVVGDPDGVSVMIAWEEAAGGVDGEPNACEIDSYLPVLITIYSTRTPASPPHWQLLDPIYAEVHRRMMGNRRRSGLAVDTRSVDRSPRSAPQACALQCRYSVQYRTRQADVELQ